MLTTLAALAATVMPLQTDTTLAVDPSQRLDVKTYAGEIVVRTWDRNEVRVQADHNRRDGIEITPSQGSILVHPTSWSGAEGFGISIEGTRTHVHVPVHGTRPRIVSFTLTVPTSMNLELGGPYADVDVAGTQGEVVVETREGDVRIQGGRGMIEVQAVEGEVTIDGSSGRIRVVSIDDDVWITNSSGEISVETLDGDIVLDQISSSSVDASSVDGEIFYRGTLESGGLYSFITHDGDITVGIPDGVGANITVATFEGEFNTSLPIDFTEWRRGRRARFTLGDGGARLEMEAFEGDIELHRASDVEPPQPDE